MFALIVKYIRPLEDVDRFLADHRSYLGTLFEAGLLIGSGPQQPRVGGVILVKGDDPETARRVVENDPFYKNGIAEYQTVQFTLTRFGNPGLEELLK